MDPYLHNEKISLPTREKVTLLNQNEKIFHVIFAEQFDLRKIEMICKIATNLRKIAKSKEGANFLTTLLSHKSAMLYFTQPSTRTYLSFVRACQYLGLNYAEVRDPSVSSSYKGESDIDGVKTFSSYFNLIIMRHNEGGFAERVAYTMNDSVRPVPVVSAGAGPDEHPTQALLDIYTLKRSFENRTKGINGIHIAFMGDVARGRTVRSLSKLLSRYDSVKITYIAPDKLKIKDDLRSWLSREKVDYNETNNFKKIIKDIDAMYVTRIQDEYDQNKESSYIDYKPYHLTLEDVEMMKPTAVVMHPLPRREELDVRIDLNHRAMYWRQERNGMWIRAALIAYLFNCEGQILDYYSTNYNY
jgi:aspartate carbamoyltransferase catalytic subunit